MRLKFILNTSYGIRTLLDNSWIGRRREIYLHFSHWVVVLVELPQDSTQVIQTLKWERCGPKLPWVSFWTVGVSLVRGNSLRSGGILYPWWICTSQAYVCLPIAHPPEYSSFYSKSPGLAPIRWTLDHSLFRTHHLTLRAGGHCGWESCWALRLRGWITQWIQHRAPHPVGVKSGKKHKVGSRPCGTLSLSCRVWKAREWH